MSQKKLKPAAFFSCITYKVKINSLIFCKQEKLFYLYYYMVPFKL